MYLRARQGVFTLLELVVSLAVVTLLLAVLLPALSSARLASRREQSAGNERQIGQAWLMYLEDHAEQFPYVPVQPGWRYGGVRFSSVDDRPFLDTQRPLTFYLPPARPGQTREDFFRCPADRGITGQAAGVGTAGRTAYRAFGTSYRANARLLDARLAGVKNAHRGLRRSEIITYPTRLVVMGEPIWYEIYEGTNRDAVWYGEPDKGNLLFLDGSVRYMRILPKSRVGPAVYEPRLTDSAAATDN